MKNTFHKAIAATALLALGFSAAPAFADAAADKITSYVEIARSVFGGDKTSGDVVSATLAAAADKGVDAQGTVGELAAALSAAEVAKADPADVAALAGIVSAVNDAAGDDAFDFASRAAATVAAVTGKDVASALSDAALADAATDPNSVLTATEKADLKDLYEKVLAALKGSGYAMKGDGDKTSVSGKGKGKKGKDKGGKGDAAASGDAQNASANAQDGDADAQDGDADAQDDDADAQDDDADVQNGGTGAKDGGADGDTEAVVYDDDENLGDPMDQTQDDPYEFHVPPTTLSGYLPPVLTPVVPAVEPSSKPKPSKPSKPKPTEPSPTPVGLF